MQRHRNLQRGCLLFIVAGSGIATLGTVGFADSVPESIRIQQKAEKAYEAAPVVPIERGNAHHRDNVKEDGDGVGAGAGGTQPAPSAEKSEKPGNK